MQPLSARGRTFLRALFALSGTTAIALLYLFLGTAGRVTRFPKPETDYYAQLAVAFADGHTDLIQHPDPSVVSDQAMFDRYWDLSLHHGRLYLYWGPVPALLDAGLLRAFAMRLTDGQLTVIFASVRALFGALLLAKAKMRFFPAQAWWPTCLGIVTFILGAPITLVLARASVYEAAIAGGQCFLLVGTYLAFVALTVPREGRTHILLLGAAGVCWSMAMGCRLGQVPVCASLAALTFAAYARTPILARPRALWRSALALASPLAAGLAAYAVYNRIRFGSIFDSGISHQISTLHYHSATRFVVPNLYSYTLMRPELGHDFPFLGLAPWDGFFLWRLVPDLSLVLNDSHFEPNAGCLWSTPFFAFAIASWVTLLVWTLRWLKRRGQAPLSPTPLLGWFMGSSLLMGTLGFAPCLVAFCSTARYLLDATAGLTLSATVGLSLLVCRPCRWKALRTAMATFASAMVVASIFVNFAFWVGGPYGDSLSSRNKPLFHALSRILQPLSP